MMEQKMPLLSVIIPVYNAARHLPDCLDSLLMQTYPAFELVCVDDGSTDDSRAMLERYARQDHRVKVFSKPNGGVSSARNFGLEHAKGEYIGFVDSDDVVLPQYLEWLYETLHTHAAAMSMCGYCCVTRKEEIPVPAECPPARWITPANYTWMAPSSGGHCWRMLTRRDILDGIRFDTSLRYGEDAVFFMQEFLKAGGLVFVDCPLYGYRIWPGSAVQQAANKNFYTEYLSWKRVWEMAENQQDPMRSTTEQRYVMACAETYYRVVSCPEITPEQKKAVLHAARTHRHAAWQIPAGRTSQKVQALMVGYCPHLGALLWQLVQHWKKAKNRKTD